MNIGLLSSRYYGKITTMTERITLLTELEYFEKHKQEYLRLYKGQFVLTNGEKFAGTFTTEVEAYKAG